MDLETTKLSLVQLVLDTNNQDILLEIKEILMDYLGRSNIQEADETQYLLHTEANKKHLIDSISQLDKGEGKTIKLSELWN